MNSLRDLRLLRNACVWRTTGGVANAALRSSQHHSGCPSTRVPRRCYCSLTPLRLGRRTVRGKPRASSEQVRPSSRNKHATSSSAASAEQSMDLERVRQTLLLVLQQMREEAVAQAVSEAMEVQRQQEKKEERSAPKGGTTDSSRQRRRGRRASSLSSDKKVEGKTAPALTSSASDVAAQGEETLSNPEATAYDSPVTVEAQADSTECEESVFSPDTVSTERPKAPNGANHLGYVPRPSTRFSQSCSGAELLALRRQQLKRTLALTPVTDPLMEQVLQERAQQLAIAGEHGSASAASSDTAAALAMTPSSTPESAGSEDDQSAEETQQRQSGRKAARVRTGDLPHSKLKKIVEKGEVEAGAAALERIHRDLSVPNISELPLHTLSSPPSQEIITSLKAAAAMHHFAAHTATQMGIIQLRRLDKAREDLRLSSAFYCRLADFGIGPEYSTTTACARFYDWIASHTPQNATERRRRDGTAAATAAPFSPEVTVSFVAREVLLHSVIAMVREHYCSSYIEPCEGEFCADVAPYAQIAPMLFTARKHVEQAVRDAYCFVHAIPFERDGVAGVQPASLYAPAPPDRVVAEIAVRVRRDVLSRPMKELIAAYSSHYADNDAVRGVNIVDEATAVAHAARAEARHSFISNYLASADVAAMDAARQRMQLCFGVAGTPVLAKMACDVEVNIASRMNQRYQALRVVERAGRTASAAKARSLTKRELQVMTQLEKELRANVRVRSFMRFIRSAKEAEAFVRNLPIAHIPAVNPHFAAALSRALGVVTCGQAVAQRTMLQFVLTGQTFDFLDNAAHGCLRFPEEDSSALCNHLGVVDQHHTLLFFATNHCSVLDAERRRILLNTPRAAHKRSIRKRYTDLRSDVRYGRLATEAELQAKVCAAGLGLIRSLRRQGRLGRHVVVTLCRDDVTADRFDHVFREPTDDLVQLCQVFAKLARRAARHRNGRRGVPQNRKAKLTVGLEINGLETRPPLPEKLMRESERLRAVYQRSCKLLHEGKLYCTLRQRVRAGEEVTEADFNPGLAKAKRAKGTTPATKADPPHEKQKAKETTTPTSTPGTPVLV